MWSIIACAHAEYNCVWANFVGRLWFFMEFAHTQLHSACVGAITDHLNREGLGSEATLRLLACVHQNVPYSEGQC